MPIALLPMTASIAPFSRVPRFGWALALCWTCLIVPAQLRAQEVTIRADVAPTGSSIDAALQDSLNLPVREAAGLQGDQVAAWAQIDRDRLSAVLRALGFYDASVHLTVDRAAAFEPDASRDRERSADTGGLRLIFDPIAGSRYRIRSVRMVDARNGEPRALAPGEAEMLDRLRDEPASADVLARFEAAWLQRQREAGHVFASVARRDVSPDPSSHTVEATLAVNQGPQARFGAVQFIGLRRISPQSLEQYAPFRVGDPYQPAQVDRLRTSLRSLPFFQSVRVEPATSLDASGLLPLRATVVEKPPEAQRLMLSGSIGIVVLGLAAVLLALAELATAGAGPSWQRHRSKITVGVWILVVTSALLALQRLLYLGDV
jgi:outer membrane translocation and assembly module TamA